MAQKKSNRYSVGMGWLLLWESILTSYSCGIDFINNKIKLQNMGVFITSSSFQCFKQPWHIKLKPMRHENQTCSAQWHSHAQTSESPAPTAVRQKILQQSFQKGRARPGTGRNVISYHHCQGSGVGGFPCVRLSSLNPQTSSPWSHFKARHIWIEYFSTNTYHHATSLVDYIRWFFFLSNFSEMLCSIMQTRCHLIIHWFEHLSRTTNLNLFHFVFHFNLVLINTYL